MNFDFRTGEGLISGDDGGRYNFNAVEWKPNKQPVAGNHVDFDVDGRQAIQIYGTQLSSSGSGAGEGEKSKIAAALLALFLGGLGIHKFYLNKGGAGAIMLLTCLLGWILLFIPVIIMCVIAFVEAIIYLTLSDEEFNRRYVEGKQSWF